MCKCILKCLLLFSAPCFGNNLQISSVTHSTVSGNHYLNFTISWDNSWRVSSNPGNWDAVWVFVKRKDCANLQWHHASLSSLSSDHSIGSPLQVDAYSDKKGVMLHRITDGSGNISMVNVQIKLDAPPAGNYEYKVSGIEMVYINQGEFYLGDGASVFSFKKGNTNNPYLVTSEASIPFSSNGSDLWTIYPSQNTFTIRNLYPKGFNAFYCMKYEISQGQYSDFLNTITQDAFQNHYDATKVNDTRFTISGAWPLMTAAAPDRACNWISIDDLTSYLDWSALSPITELEFEKICRGNSINFPVANECAWGGNQITDANTITPGTNGLPTETVDDVIATGTGLANYSNGGIIGPLRCGFAARSNATRFEAGASYYGVMEMSGNVFELCFNADSSTFGRSYLFNGSHGDGELSITPFPGYSNQNWPGQTPLDFTEQYFTFAIRGGAWSSPLNPTATQLSISDRTFPIISIGAGLPNPDGKGRSSAFGGRGVSRR